MINTLVQKSEMQKSKTYLSSPQSSQTLTASNLTASNPLSTLKTASNLLTFTYRLSCSEDFVPILQKLSQKPSVFVFCGIKNFDDILVRYVNSLGNCCFKCGVFYAFGSYELSNAEGRFLSENYEYFREVHSLTEQISTIRAEFIQRLAPRQQKNPQLQAYYLTVVDVIQLSATTCRQVILVNAESDEDVLAIVQFLQKYYCFGDLEMYKYSGFIEYRKVKFQDMQIYNQLSGIEAGYDYFSSLVLTRVFHIFTEVLQNEELLTKISTLRDCACVQQKPRLNRFDQVGMKQFQRAMRGDYTMKYIQCKNGVLRFSTDVVDDSRKENSIALCEDVAEYIRTINDFDDLEAVELDTQEKYIINLRERTDQLILKLRARLEHSQAQMNDLKQQFEDNIKQAALRFTKLLAKSDKIEAQIYESIMKSQVFVVYQLEKQLAQQEFVQLEMDRPDLLFSTPDNEILEYTHLCERIELEMPQKPKQQSRVQMNQQADRLDLVLRSQKNAKKQIYQANTQIQHETEQIIQLRQKVEETKAATEQRQQELNYVSSYRKDQVELLRLKQLLESYTKFIQMYYFYDKMPSDAQNWYTYHEYFIVALRKVTLACHSDSPELRAVVGQLREAVVKFLQGKASQSYYDRLCGVCQKVSTLVSQL